MQLIVMYIEKDMKYYIFNVLCSDEFIEVLRKILLMIRPER